MNILSSTFSQLLIETGTKYHLPCRVKNKFDSYHFRNLITLGLHLGNICSGKHFLQTIFCIENNRTSKALLRSML